MDDYHPRVIDALIDEALTQPMAVLIEGPKGIGKTTSASRVSHDIIRLTDAGDLALAQADPDRIIEQAGRPLLIDEWQHHPAMWEAVRRSVDATATPQILMTGSAGPKVQPTHSGAARIVRHRMRPLSLAERWDLELEPSVSLTSLFSGEREDLTGRTTMSLDSYIDEILRSGIPRLRAMSGPGQRNALNSYIDNITDRDFSEAGIRVKAPETLRQWLRAYGAATGTTAKWGTIRDATRTASGATAVRATVNHYRDVLEGTLWILDPVPGWRPTNNPFGQLNVSPKHFLADPAIAAALRGLNRSKLAKDGTALGQLFESLVAQSLKVYASASYAEVHHMRTPRGDREVDFIITDLDGAVVGVEVKLSKSVDDDDVKHLRWLQDKLGADCADCIVITTGSDAYRRADGIGVVPAALLGP